MQPEFKHRSASTLALGSTAKAAQHNSVSVASAQGTSASDVVGHLPFIAQSFNFVVLAGLLVFFTRAKLRKALAARHRSFVEATERASQARKEAEQTLQEYREKLERLAKETEEIRKVAQDRAEDDAQAMLNAARVESETLIRSTELRLQALVRDTEKRLASETVEATLEKLEAQLSSELDAAARTRFFERGVAALAKADTLRGQA